MTNQWLVRTAQNQILGPFDRAKICQMIQKGELKLEDEVCAANHYWIYLHERTEIWTQLGIKIPKGDSDEEDTTETQCVRGSDEERTDPELNPSLKKK